MLCDSICIKFLQVQTYLWWQKADACLSGMVQQKHNVNILIITVVILMVSWVQTYIKTYHIVYFVACFLYINIFLKIFIYFGCAVSSLLCSGFL